MDLTQDELLEMWQRYVADGRTDDRLRDRLVTHYFPLTLKVAGSERSKRPVNTLYDEFDSWAQAGLLRAVDNYDPKPRDGHKRAVTFETYAVASMKSCIMDGLRKEDWAPRWLRERQRQLETGRSELRNLLGRHPYDAETAAHLGIEIDVVKQTDAEVAASWHSYIEDDSEQLSKRSVDEAPEEGAVGKVIRAAVAEEMPKLNEVGRTVLALHYFEEIPLKEIARMLSVSTSYVSTVHNGAVLQVHEAILRAVGATPLALR